MGYIRKIIYLNEYDGGSSGKNVGFVKMSKKETRLKIEINLSEDRALQGEKVYLLDKDKNAVNKVLFGTITTDGKNITMTKENSEIKMIKGEPVGMIIGGDSYIVCAGTDDNTLHVTDYLRQTEEKKMIQEQTDTESEGKQIWSEEEAERLDERTSQEEKEKRPEETVVQEEKEKRPEHIESQEEKPQQQVSESEQAEEEEEEEIIQVEIEEEHDEWYEYRKILSSHTSMYPFEDDEMEECVQISPGDFSNFPKEFWHLGSNSFLLQGYYNYRHLILAVANGKIYIGIPGQYHRRDKYLADMFGFKKFKSIHKRPEKLGDFGYWMMEIEVPVPAGPEDAVCVRGKGLAATE